MHVRHSRTTLAALLLGVLGVLGSTGPTVRAQFQMPDPKQMAGIPRPVTDLPNGTVSVRLIRGQLSNNITNFPVELHVGAEVKTVKTDEAGRAEFRGLPPGATLKAVATVDGERLESEEFPAPDQGGIRLMLVATDKSKSAAADTPAIAGQVVIAGETRIILEPGDESLSVYYLLDVVNASQSPVTPPAAFAFDMPKGAVGTSLLEGSSPTAMVDGPHVRVEGPFAPGRSSVRVACSLPIGRASLELTQRFPAALEQLAVIVKKTGETTLVSSQIAKQQDMTASGEVFIAATGGTVAAGNPIVLTLENLPHHSAVPRWIALSLAGAILLGGVWMSKSTEDQEARSTERKRLLTRREKLFADLVRLEHDRRNGKVSPARHAARREELIASLEQVYGALDDDDVGPGPSDRPGLAA